MAIAMLYYVLRSDYDLNHSHFHQCQIIDASAVIFPLIMSQ